MQVGFVDAGTQDSAVGILSSHDLFILKIEEAEKTRWYDRIAHYWSGVKRQDMVIFTRQLSTLLEARVSLSRALATLYAQTKNATLKEAVYQVGHDVDSGLSFSQALEKQPQIFSGFFVSMIRSAEVTGNLDKVTGFLADYVEREATIITKARSALIYPGILVGLFFGVAVLMVTVVFPQIKPVFEESGVELPFISKLLIDSGIILGHWWPAVIVVLVIALGVILDYLQTPEGQAFADDMKIRLPILRRVYIPLTITRFASAATMLIKGDVPVAQAMEVVGETVDNVLYRDVLHEVSQDIREGITLSEAIGRHPEYFPSLVAQIIAVGESTGQLDQMFARISTFYNREADTLIDNMVDLIQPVVMILIGLMVGFLFATVLVPLYSLTGSIGG